MRAEALGGGAHVPDLPRARECLEIWDSLAAAGHPNQCFRGRRFDWKKPWLMEFIRDAGKQITGDIGIEQRLQYVHPLSLGFGFGSSAQDRKKRAKKDSVPRACRPSSWFTSVNQLIHERQYARRRD